MALPSSRPWPARITGRSAALISASASRNCVSCGGGPGRPCGRGAAASQSNVADDCCASLVMSTSTGTGTAAAREVERLADCGRDVRGLRDEVVVLGDRQRDAGDVGFLERVGSDQAAADLAGDADDRRRIHHRGREAGDHVGRARTRRRDRDADLAGRARVAVGHVRRALLVPRQDVPDRIRRASRRRPAGSRRPDNRRRRSRLRGPGIPRESAHQFVSYRVQLPASRSLPTTANCQPRTPANCRLALRTIQSPLRRRQTIRAVRISPSRPVSNLGAGAIHAASRSAIVRGREVHADLARWQVDGDDVAVVHRGDRSASRGFRRDVADHQAARRAGKTAVGNERDRFAESGADDRRR